MHRVAAMTLLGLFGCAAGPGGPGATGRQSPGDPQARPSLKALPGVGRVSGSERTRQGILVAREGFDARLPATPADLSFESLQAWVGDEVVAWIGARDRNVKSARFEFGLDGNASPGERIVGFAVIGLLQEDTARELATIPPPAELESEPEIAQLYREVIEHQARPFLSSALVGFRECADLAHDGPEDMRHWAGFCDGRFQRLKREVDAEQRRILGQPPEEGPEPSADGTVTIIIES